MSEIVGAHQTQAQAYFCPQCGSPSIVTPLTIVTENGGSPAECKACPWKGDRKDLAVAPFKHEFKSDEDIAQNMMRDLRNVLAKSAAVTYGKFLLKWGFLDQPISALQLARYMDSIAQAVVRTIIETRTAMAEEKSRERVGVPGAPGDQSG